MLELIIPAAAALTGTGYFLRHHVYSFMLQRSLDNLPASAQVRYNKLIEEYKDRIPEGKASSLAAHLHFVDLATKSTDKLNEKKLLELPRLPEPVEENVPQDGLVVDSLLGYMRSKRRGYFTPDDIKDFSDTNTRKSFIAFLLMLEMDLDRARHYDTHYQTLLIENRELISTVSMVAPSIVRKSKEERWKVLYSIEHTLDETLKRHAQKESERDDYDIQYFMRLLDEPDDIPQLIEAPVAETPPEPAPRTTAPPLVFNYLRRHNNIRPSIKTFMLQTIQKDDTCFYLTQSFVDYHYPTMPARGADHLLEKLLSNTFAFETQKLFSNRYNTMERFDPDVIDTIVQYLKGTYMHPRQARHSVLVYHEREYYILRFKDDYVIT